MLSRFARWAIRGACPRSEAVSWMCPEVPTSLRPQHLMPTGYVADDTVSYATVNGQQLAYLRMKCALGTYHQVASTRQLGSMVIEKCVFALKTVKRRSGAASGAETPTRPSSQAASIRVDGP